MSEHRVFVHDMKNLLGIILGYRAPQATTRRNPF